MTAIPSGLRIPPGAAVLARPGVLALAAAVAGLAFRLQKAWSDISDLVLAVTSDDAFYYFGIARNIAGGHNVSFDGETLTNGFHPLWMVILTPMYLVTDSQEMPIHLALTVAAVLSAGTVLLVYAIVRALTANPWAALVAALFYAIHAYLIVEAVNGMETALTMFMVALTTWLFLRIVGGERASAADYAWLGLSAGLMVLARTDTIFILPPLLAFLALRERGRQRWRGALTSGGLALLVVAPWAIWSLVTFGTVIQVSGVAVADIDRQAFLDIHGSSFATQLDHAWDLTSDWFFEQLPHLYLVPRDGPRTPLLLTTAALIGVMLLAPLTPQRRRARRQIGLLLVPTIGIVASLLFHTAFRWHVREWYFAPVALVGAALLGVLVDYGHGILRETRFAWGSGPAWKDAPDAAMPPAPPARWRSLAVPAFYGAVVLALVLWFGPQRSEHWEIRLPHRLNMLEAARWLERNTEPDARIGSLNAGIIGYFSDRTVINLDGVVNEDAYEARRDGRLFAYVRSKEIRYLVDLESALDSLRASEEPSPPLELVATIGKPLYYLGGGRVDVLEVLPDGAAGGQRRLLAADEQEEGAPVARAGPGQRLEPAGDR